VGYNASHPADIKKRRSWFLVALLFAAADVKRYAKIFKKRGDMMATKTSELISMVESLPVDIKTTIG
jgi:hypothetical protein